MNIKEFKEQILSASNKVDEELQGQMFVQWQLEGKKEAFQDVKKMLEELIEQSYGEILRQTSDIEIARRARMVVECYKTHNVNGNNYYDIHQMESVFFDGAKWILNQLKINE